MYENATQVWVIRAAMQPQAEEDARLELGSFAS